MGKQESTFAIFYNFKDESCCPFCKLIKDVYDIGGSKMVFERLGIFNVGDHEHNFPKCFVHHYWITDTYDDTLKPRPVKTVVLEGVEVFKKMKSLLAIQ